MACDRGDHGKCTRCGIRHPTVAPGVREKVGDAINKARTAAYFKKKTKYPTPAQQLQMRWRDAEGN